MEPLKRHALLTCAKGCSLKSMIMIVFRNNKKLLGRVKAFDRHCNMVLEGVKEMWTELPKTGKGRLKEDF